MPATLDLLEAKKRATFATLREGEHEHRSFDAVVSRLEGQIKALYQWAIQQSKGELSVREVFDLWDKMVAVCDFFIDYVRDMANEAARPTAFDGLLDMRLACDEKREFHRCG